MSSSSSGSISGLRPASAGYRNRSTTRGIFPLTGILCGDGCAAAGWICPARRISRPWSWLSRHEARMRNTSCFLSSGCRKTRWKCGAAGIMSFTMSGKNRDSSRRQKGTSSIMVSSRSSSKSWVKHTIYGKSLTTGGTPPRWCRTWKTWALPWCLSARDSRICHRRRRSCSSS